MLETYYEGTINYLNSVIEILYPGLFEFKKGGITPTKAYVVEVWEHPNQEYLGCLLLNEAECANGEMSTYVIDNLFKNNEMKDYYSRILKIVNFYLRLHIDYITTCEFVRTYKKEHGDFPGFADYTAQCCKGRMIQRFFDVDLYIDFLCDYYDVWDDLYKEGESDA